MAIKQCGCGGVIEAGSCSNGCSGLNSPGCGCTCNAGYTNNCCNSCGCTAQPYYKDVNMCPQNSKQTVYVQKISQVFKNKTAFAMPLCGSASIRVVFDGISDVAIGAWMWANGIGYLQVEGFNPYTQEIELSNPCPEQCGTQVPPGSPIPACTIFVLTVPPCPNQSGGPLSTFPYLNSGFTAPGVGVCIPITVTNVNGLSVNRNVSINSGIYRISAITSATNITICNDGSGLTPGTVVTPTDANGNLIVPVVLIDSNPCLNTAQFSGAPLACLSGVMVPLVGNSTGQVLTYDDDTGLASFRSIAFPALECTTLLVCVTIDDELPPDTEYLIEVADTSIFTVGELINIESGAGGFFVTQIIDETHMRVVTQLPPTSSFVIPEGTAVCKANCCAVIDADLTERLSGTSTWIPTIEVLDSADDSVEGTVSGVIINQADYSRVADWYVGKVSVQFEISAATVNATRIRISAPPVDGDDDSIGAAYVCHADDVGVWVNSFYRYSDAFDVFQAAIAPWNDGAARVDIEFRFKATPS